MWINRFDLSWCLKIPHQRKKNYVIHIIYKKSKKTQEMETGRESWNFRKNWCGKFEPSKYYSLKTERYSTWCFVCVLRSHLFLSCVSLFVHNVLPVFQLLLLWLLFAMMYIMLIHSGPNNFRRDSSIALWHTHTHTIDLNSNNLAYSLIWKMMKTIHHCFSNANFIFIWL